MLMLRDQTEKEVTLGNHRHEYNFVTTKFRKLPTWKSTMKDFHNEQPINAETYVSTNKPITIKHKQVTQIK